MEQCKCQTCESSSSTSSERITFFSTALSTYGHPINGYKSVEKCTFVLWVCQCDHRLRLWNISKLKEQLEWPSAKQPLTLHSLLALLFCTSYIQFGSGALAGLTFGVTEESCVCCDAVNNLNPRVSKKLHFLTCSVFLVSDSDPLNINNVHDSTSSIQHVTVAILCPPELLVASVKISSLLFTAFWLIFSKRSSNSAKKYISSPPVILSPLIPPLTHTPSYPILKLMHINNSGIIFF